MHLDIYVLIVHKPIVEAKFHNPCGRKRAINKIGFVNFGTKRMDSLNFGFKRKDFLNFGIKRTVSLHFGIKRTVSRNFGIKRMDSLNFENPGYLLFLNVNLNLRV